MGDKFRSIRRHVHVESVNDSEPDRGTEEATRAVYRAAQGLEALSRGAFRETAHHFRWAAAHMRELLRLKGLP